MNPCKSILRAASSALAILAMPLVAPAPAVAQSGGRNEYAVKFVCGTNARPNLSPAAAPGTYYTAINVHSPSNETVPFVHKVALAEPGRAGRFTRIVSPIRLAYDEATDVDCEQIARELAAGGITPGPFFTGFFVIQCPQELDVVAVYTAAPSRTGAVATMTTERVPVRRHGG
jgi:hypothetical protein